MKIKKSLVKIVLIGGIFFISAMSFWGIISLQDDNINNFWSVSKLDISFIWTSYAESGWWESGRKSYKKESGWSYNNIKVKTSDPVVNTQIIVEKKVITLNSDEKKWIKDRFKKVYNLVNKKYDSDYKKLNTYKKLNFLLEEKIATLELIKINIKDEDLLEKYEKKILLFNELNTLTQESVLIYIDSIELEKEKQKVVLKEQPIVKKQSNVNNKVNNSLIKNEVNNQLKIDQEQARQLANEKKKAADIAEAKRLEQIRKDIEIARAKKATKEAELARLAKIEAERIAVENARIAAEQKAAKAAANTHTKAS